MALKFKGGVLLAADSRTAAGSFITHRVSDKITRLYDDIYVCRSGTSADTQTLTAYASYFLDSHAFIKKYLFNPLVYFVFRITTLTGNN